MFTYTGTTCPKCGQPHTISTVWMSVLPQTASCGCQKPGIITSNITQNAR